MSFLHVMFIALFIYGPLLIATDGYKRIIWPDVRNIRYEKEQSKIIKDLGLMLLLVSFWCWVLLLLLITVERDWILFVVIPAAIIPWIIVKGIHSKTYKQLDDPP